ncbi:hypothetical protein ACTXMB_15095 [Arthrobacter rhombi]|uniref:hypothetical protein n=1 Tax=Arthrobacter rhombi TaxID=71253 RepID=UPI003FD56FE4
MKIQKDRFDAWATSAWNQNGPCTPSQVAKIAGISKSSLFFQRSKDYVEASVVIALSRAMKLRPMEELLKFDEYKAVETGGKPTEVEILSQVGPELFMEELLARLHHHETLHDPGTMPESNGLKRWLDAVNMYGRYEEIAAALGLANIRVLSKKVNENRFTLGELLALCELGGLSFRFGLVVTGYLTWEEAGFAWDIRESTLREAPGEALIEVLWSSRRWLEKAVQVKEVERSVYQSFG